MMLGLSASNTFKNLGELMFILKKSTFLFKFSILPFERLSTTEISKSSSNSRSHKCDPMNPAPPVTRTFFFFISAGFCKLHLFDRLFLTNRKVMKVFGHHWIFDCRKFYQR